jgi:hypothetical protein
MLECKGVYVSDFKLYKEDQIIKHLIIEANECIILFY